MWCSNLELLFVWDKSLKSTTISVAKHVLFSETFQEIKLMSGTHVRSNVLTTKQINNVLILSPRLDPLDFSQSCSSNQTGMLSFETDDLKKRRHLNLMNRCLNFLFFLLWPAISLTTILKVRRIIYPRISDQPRS